MSADLKTKYTTVGVDVDNADPKENYFGYVSINFDLDNDESRFFAESYDQYLLDQVKDLLKSEPNLMVDKEIRLEDASILIDLPSVRQKVIAADVYNLVKKVERKFNEKAGL